MVIDTSDPAKSLVTGKIKRYTEDDNTNRSLRIPENDENSRSDEDEDDPIQFKAKESTDPADIKLRIDAPESADNAVEVY